MTGEATNNKFQPEPEQLPSIGQLIALTVTTKQDIENAIADWEDDPPDKKFETILNASIEDYG
jgi:hypothetical protein